MKIAPEKDFEIFRKLILAEIYGIHKGTLRSISPPKISELVKEKNILEKSHAKLEKIFEDAREFDLLLSIRAAAIDMRSKIIFLESNIKAYGPIKKKYSKKGGPLATSFVLSVLMLHALVRITKHNKDDIENLYNFFKKCVEIDRRLSQYSRNPFCIKTAFNKTAEDKWIGTTKDTLLKTLKSYYKNSAKIPWNIYKKQLLNALEETDATRWPGIFRFIGSEFADSNLTTLKVFTLEGQPPDLPMKRLALLSDWVEDSEDLDDENRKQILDIISAQARKLRNLSKS